MSEKSRTRLLLICNDPDLTDLFKAYFDASGYEIRVVQTAEAGLHAAYQFKPALAMLSPDSAYEDPLSLLAEFRAKPRTMHLPLIILAGRSQRHLQNVALSSGADDFMAEPFDYDILALRIRNLLQRRQREGLVDSRSGLPTGPLLEERIARLESEKVWARIDLMIADFDAFQDVYGFIAADDVINFAGDVICEIVDHAGTADDFVGHIGGTHFVAITTETIGQQLATQITEAFRERVQQFYSFIEVDQGYIRAHNGFGDLEPRNLMTFSIAVTTGEPGQHDETAAEDSTRIRTQVDTEKKEDFEAKEGDTGSDTGFASDDMPADSPFSW